MLNVTNMLPYHLIKYNAMSDVLLVLWNFVQSFLFMKRAMDFYRFLYFML